MHAHLDLPSIQPIFRHSTRTRPRIYNRNIEQIYLEVQNMYHQAAAMA